MISLEHFSELLEVLYAAPLDREQWPRFLTLLGQHIRAGALFLFAVDAGAGFFCSEHSDSPGASLVVEQYNLEHNADDPFRTGVIRAGRPGIYNGDELVSPNAFLRSRIYKSLLGPSDLRFATVLSLAASVRRFEAISIWHTSAHGPIDPESKRLLTLLFPHVCRAFEVSHLLGIVSRRLKAAEIISDASHAAALIVTQDHRVIYRNAAADSLLEEGSTVVLREGRLSAAASTSRTVLRDLVSQAIKSRGVPQQSHLGASSLCSTDGAHHLQVIVTPLPERQRKESGGEVLVLITDSEQRPTLHDKVLRELYGLTTSETEVANGLLMGYSSGEIASLRKVAKGTVRNQMKSIFAKTATSRQSDLVRLLLTLPRTPDM